MKVSIITATYNSEKTLQNAIDSVQSQDYPNIEHLVIDGGSKDSTLQIILKNQDRIARYISEKDGGIYDALNKGISLASGHFIGILHSDDEFASTDVISKIVNAVERNKCDAVYGDLVYVDQSDTNRIIRKWKSQEYSTDLFYKGWMPAHPTFFLRANCFKEYGDYNLSFFTSADYELLLRMFVRFGISSSYIPEVLVKMRVGGQSNVSWKNRWIANQEDAKAWRVNGLKPKIYTRWLKPLSKIGQYL